ncbi:uncharacterized protein LOC131670617 [Phymastichus coffea]|uniref:uncharacterized protein LOC131670617 n=1 Tax=Phymastichus coffea TaxID=108790 RepID=UPI00273A8084|nr:uncharacterized protein LOC131670617 [Phymastichus coffea]
MELRPAFILLLCSACVSAQYSDESSGGGTTLPKKSLQIPRRLKAQSRLSGPTSQQTTIINQRFRRPIPINKPRPSSEPIPELPVFTSGIRGSRPSSAALSSYEQNDDASAIPIQTIQQPHIVHAQSIHPTPPPQQLVTEVKPVSEENDKDQDVVQVIANLGAISGFSGQGNLLTPTVASPIPTSTVSSFLHQQQEKQHERQYHQQQIQPVQYRSPHPLIKTAPTIHPEQIHQVIQPVQYRPQKPVRLHKQQQQQQQFTDRSEYELNEARPLAKQRPQVAPKKSKPQSGYYEGRTKKPVAQVIRRYREETADGSIIWGFENDDGSFKEEIIGIDCITRGKYGYVDPDGVRREYTYETGIKCDEETQQQDQDILNTFVDYQENKLVLPSGKTIDLSSMGKKQARRPQPIYRN